MAIRGVDFKWYDGFFLSMLATSIIIVTINWKRYNTCTYPLHIWIVVDYTSVFAFRLLLFIDNALATGMGLDFGWQQQYARFCGRVVVLSILSLLLYPVLCVWTVIGTLWFKDAKDCVSQKSPQLTLAKSSVYRPRLFSSSIVDACSCQKKVKNGVFSFGCFLATVLCFALLALQWERLSIFCWLVRRQAHMLRAQQGIPVSEYGVLVDMIRVPDWAFEVAGLETRGFDQDSTGYHPGLFLTSAQREAVEALIQELPKFRLKAVPTDCSECPICLEEFHVGNEVRGMPCAHNFHVECIDEWLRLNVKCPRCRSSVFPNLDLSALSDLRSDTDQTPTNGYITRQPSSLSTSSPVPAAHTVNTQASIPTLP